MRALLVDHSAPTGLRLGEAPDPVPARNEAYVRVTATSLNPAHGRTIVTFFLPNCPDLGPDLTWLARRVHAGLLRPRVSWRGGWRDADDAVRTLLERRLHGKAVLDLD